MTQSSKLKHKPRVNAQVLQMRARGYTTAREAATRAGISVARIYALVAEGTLQAVRAGKGLRAPVYIKIKSLTEYFGGALGPIGATT